MSIPQHIAKGVLRAGGPVVIVAGTNLVKYLGDTPEDPFGRLRPSSSVPPRVVAAPDRPPQRALEADPVVWRAQPQQRHQRQQRQKNKHQQQYHQQYHQQYQQPFQLQAASRYDQPEQEESKQHQYQSYYDYGYDSYQCGQKQPTTAQYHPHDAIHSSQYHQYSTRCTFDSLATNDFSTLQHQDADTPTATTSPQSLPKPRQQQPAREQQQQHGASPPLEELPKPKQHHSPTQSSVQLPRQQTSPQQHQQSQSRKDLPERRQLSGSGGARLSVHSRPFCPRTTTPEHSMSSTTAPPIQQNYFPMAASTSSRLLQDFILEEEIGRGGFGRVFRAKNRFDLLDYATKVVVNQVMDKSAYNEARILAKISHPNIVRYHCAWLEPLAAELRSLMQKSGSEVSSASNTPISALSQSASGSCSNLFVDDGGEDVSTFFPHPSLSSLSSSVASVASGSRISSGGKASLESMGSECSTLPSTALVLQMELLSNWTLADWIAVDRGPTWSQTVVIVFSQILEALDYIHSRGIVHRDVKPSNVFFVQAPSQTDLPFVKLGDFGLSLELRSVKKSGHKVDFGSQNTAGVGTAIYASPEQNSGDVCDGKADMFALGIMLFECLAPRFNTMSERLVILQGLRKGEVPSEFVKQHPQVSNLVASLLSSNPNHRPGARQVLGLPLFHVPSTSLFPQLAHHYHAPVHFNLAIRKLEEDLRRRDATIAQLNEQLRGLQPNI